MCWGPKEGISVEVFINLRFFLIWVSALPLSPWLFVPLGSELWKTQAVTGEHGVTVPRKALFWWWAWLFLLIVAGVRIRAEALSPEPWPAVWFFCPPFSHPLVSGLTSRGTSGVRWALWSQRPPLVGDRTYTARGQWLSWKQGSQSQWDRDLSSLIQTLPAARNRAFVFWWCFYKIHSASFIWC